MCRPLVSSIFQVLYVSVARRKRKPERLSPGLFRCKAATVTMINRRLILRGCLYIPSKTVTSTAAIAILPKRTHILQLMQQGKSGKSIKQRCLRMHIDSYARKGPKTTQIWPRKKIDKPPKPPKTRPAKAKDIQRAKQLGVKYLII